MNFLGKRREGGREGGREGEKRRPNFGGYVPCACFVLIGVIACCCFFLPFFFFLLLFLMFSCVLFPSLSLSFSLFLRLLSPLIYLATFVCSCVSSSSPSLLAARSVPFFGCVCVYYVLLYHVAVLAAAAAAAASFLSLCPICFDGENEKTSLTVDCEKVREPLSLFMYV